MKRWFFGVPVMLGLVACGDGKPAEAPPRAPPLTPTATVAASTATAADTVVVPVASATPPVAVESKRVEKCTAGAFDPALGCVAASRAAAPDAHAEAELTALIADVKKHFPDAKKCPAKTSVELFDAHGKWNALAKSATDYDAKLSAVGMKLRTPHALTMTSIVSGLMFTRLATMLRACAEDNMQLYTPEQQKMLTAMATSGRDDLKEKSNELQTAVKEAFRARKDREGEAVEEVASKRLASGVVLANAFGFGDDAIRDAWAAWSDLRVMVGPRVATYFASMRDPTDPDQQRALAPFMESLAPKWTASTARGD